MDETEARYTSSGLPVVDEDIYNKVLSLRRSPFEDLFISYEIINDDNGHLYTFLISDVLGNIELDLYKEGYKNLDTIILSANIKIDLLSLYLLLNIQSKKNGCEFPVVSEETIYGVNCKRYDMDEKGLKVRSEYLSTIEDGIEKENPLVMKFIKYRVEQYDETLQLYVTYLLNLEYHLLEEESKTRQLDGLGLEFEIPKEEV